MLTPSAGRARKGASRRGPAEAGARSTLGTAARTAAIHRSINAGRRWLVPPQSIFGHAIRDRLHLVRSEALELRTPSSSRTPPQDLQAHNCIRLRFPSGAFLPWRFSIEGKTLELDVNGSLMANDADLLVHVALNGTGVVYVLRDFAAP